MIVMIKDNVLVLPNLISFHNKGRNLPPSLLAVISNQMRHQERIAPRLRQAWELSGMSKLQSLESVLYKGGRLDNQPGQGHPVETECVGGSIPAREGRKCRTEPGSPREGFTRCESPLYSEREFDEIPTGRQRLHSSANRTQFEDLFDSDFVDTDEEPDLMGACGYWEDGASEGTLAVRALGKSFRST